MSEGPLPDEGSTFGRRVRERLAREQVIWLTTIGADGTPQPNPVWFVWEDPDTLLVYNRPDAYRLTHVLARPRVCLHFNANAAGNDIAVFTGTPSVTTPSPPPHEHPTYREKYAEGMVRVSGTCRAVHCRVGSPSGSSASTVSAATPESIPGGRACRDRCFVELRPGLGGRACRDRCSVVELVETRIRQAQSAVREASRGEGRKADPVRAWPMTSWCTSEVPS